MNIKQENRLKKYILLLSLVSFSVFAQSVSEDFLRQNSQNHVDIGREIKQRYEVKWTNLNTQKFYDINHLVKDIDDVEDFIFSSYDMKDWQINEPIVIEFSQPIFQGDIQSLYFIASNQSSLKYADTNGLLDLKVDVNNQGSDWQYQQILTISPELFYLSQSNVNGSQKKLINFPFATTYSVYVNAYVDNKIQEFRLLTFETPSIGVFAERLVGEVEISDDWQSKLTSKEQENLQISQHHHGKESAQENFRAFSGVGVTIAIQDDGIRQDSHANKRVRFKLQDLPDSLLGPPSWQGAAHGTLMADFITDYAPSVELLDFNIFPYAQHLSKRMASGFQKHQLENHNYAALARILGADLMSVSLISPRLQGRSRMWTEALMSGLVISKSLGNDNAVTHLVNQQNCTDPIHFAPYFAEYDNIDLQQAEGALVTLQAALKTQNGYVSLRSHAGDAAPYTLTVLETQRGATSQATATFSGIFALIKEAANRYNRNYSNKQLVEILFETADDIGETGIDSVYGYGLVNIDKALREVERGYAPSIRLYRDLNSDIDVQLLERIYTEGCSI